MGRLILFGGFVLLACAASRVDARPAVHRDAGLPWCAPASDRVADFMLQTLGALATSPSPEMAFFRDSTLRGMPRVTRDQVVLVTDEALCERGSRAIDSAFFQGTPHGLSVYMVRMGTYFGVLPKTASETGVYHSMLFTDSTFRAVAKTLF